MTASARTTVDDGRPTVRPGSAGSHGVLNLRNLPKLNVRGEGEFEVGQDGDQWRLSWSRLKETSSETQDESNISGTAVNRPRLDLDDLEASTLGGLGELAGRLTGPIQFVRKLMECWRLDRKEMVRLLGYDPDDAEYGLAVLDGKLPLHGRDVRDRIAHLFCIRRTLWSLFRDLEVENEWLRERHRVLNEKSPLSLMLEGSMEDMLLAREYVEAAAGVR